MDRSPLGRLAPELRKYIYDLTLPTEQPLKLTVGSLHTIALYSTEETSKCALLNLAKTCKAMGHRNPPTLLLHQHLQHPRRRLPQPSPALRRTRFCEQIGYANATALCSVVMDCGTRKALIGPAYHIVKREF